MTHNGQFYDGWGLAIGCGSRGLVWMKVIRESKRSILADAKRIFDYLTTDDMRHLNRNLKTKGLLPIIIRRVRFQPVK